ncbi:MAG: hypothetical protein HOP13_18980 [Alphaproteobacteria bacterium]|nr:hypothetical protein [Alphaproteobacteria bacterium]
MLQSALRTVTTAFLGAITLAACSNDSAFIRTDVEAIARDELASKAEVTLIDAWVGEGDADHRYYNADIKVRALERLRIEAGLFKGLSMDPGDPPRLFTIELSYQWRDGNWLLIQKALVSKSSRPQ